MAFDLKSLSPKLSGFWWLLISWSVKHIHFVGWTLRDLDDN